MKKRILSALAALMLLCAGCADAEPSESVSVYSAEDFTMRIDNQYVTPHSTELFYTISCLDGICDGKVSYGKSYILEKQNTDGEWISVPTADGSEYIAFADMSYNIYGHSVCESIPMDAYIGSLTEGHYRLVKELNGDIPLTAEFDVIPSDISFELHDADNVTTDTKLLKYSFIYNGDGTREYICGIGYTLEKQDENGEWQYVQSNGCFTQIGYHLSQSCPEFGSAIPIAGDHYAEPITTGEYRISAQLSNREKLRTPDRKEHLLHERFCAEFTIN